MSFCLACGASLKPGAKFCGACGVVVMAQSISQRSPPPARVHTPTQPYANSAPAWNPALPPAPSSWPGAAAIAGAPAPYVPGVNAGSAIPLNQLRSPREATARFWVILLSLPIWVLILFFVLFPLGVTIGYGNASMIGASLLSTLIWVGFIALIIRIAEGTAAAYIRTNGIMTSPTQLAGVYRASSQCAGILGLPQVEVYVLRGGAWNALAARLAGRSYIVLFAEMLDSILIRGDMAPLAFIVGHEYGHFAAGHLSFGHRILDLLGNTTGLFQLWHRRHMELTADRIGLYCVGRLKPALDGLSSYVVGGNLVSQVDARLAGDQWYSIRHELLVWLKKVGSPYPEPLRRLYELIGAAAQFGLPT